MTNRARAEVARRCPIRYAMPTRSAMEVIVMRWKAMSIGIAFLAMVLGTTSAMAQSSPPPSPKARETEALVNKAAALIYAKGRAAFSEFRVKGTEWFHGDIYLFSYDLKGNVLLNPAFPAREGTNVSGQKDANGKQFHDAIIRTAETKGSGWVDYMFPKPGHTQASRKWAFVKAVKIDGVSGLVASGFYPE